MVAEFNANAIAQTENNQNFLAQIQEQAAELSRVFLSFCQTIWVAPGYISPQGMERDKRVFGMAAKYGDSICSGRGASHGA
ncbi:hypothetical protein [Scytonema sp. PCC 10023]|uniref:hypothetical protein n=1 Tax=Scytonema sp. PCC 10023 TaxID=1680591 RepID=UPI0039C61F1F